MEGGAHSGRRDAVSPQQNFRSQRGEGSPVGLSLGANQQIPRRLPASYLSPPDLAQPSPQTIAGHRGGLEARNQESNPRMAH